MKVNFSLMILIVSFVLMNCDFDLSKDETENSNNINIESISYELTYNNYSVVKVTIKTYDEFGQDVSFIGYLKSKEGKKEYIMRCSSYFYDIIECFSQKNVTFDLNDLYYFYYNKTKSSITFDENDVLEDDREISLLFKPEISIEDRLYKDNRKIIAETGGKIVEGGVLYIAKKSKKILNRPKDGFNKYIELKNFIGQACLNKFLPLCTFSGYKEIVKKGYHMVDAILRFSKDYVPVISNEEDLEKISNGTGQISLTTIKKLWKLDFGSKFSEKYAGEKILTFEILLQLCKDYNIIIDLDLSYLDPEKSEIYANVIYNLTKTYNMFNSIYFSEGGNCSTIKELLKLKKDITISVPVLKKKEDVDKIKTHFVDSKRIIFSFAYKDIDEETVKYIKSLGHKVKVDTIDDKIKAKNLLSWGVDFIKTDSLYPFYIQNEVVDPIPVRCVPVDKDHSECEIDDEITLADNEWYNIYYSENIFNISEDINEEPLEEFQYVNTNILDELYYVIDKFDFKEGILRLNLSHILKKGESIYGEIGPDYDDVGEYYHYNFTCPGNDNHTVNCHFATEEYPKYTGNYRIYFVEDYSLNEFELEEKGDFNDEPEEGTGPKKEETYVEYVEYFVEKKRSHFLTFLIIFICIICFVVIYCWKCRKSEQYNRIRIADNNYLSDDYLFR